MTDSEQAERLTQRRARQSVAMAMIFLVTQMSSLHGEAPLSRSQTLHVAAWTVWAVALLLFLVVGGGLLRGRRVRALMNDETTLDHRRRATTTGFWAAIATCFVLWAASFYEPVTARDAVRMVITITIATALLRFGILERRSLRGG